ncbi:YbjN domain-containing protein [uncultured Jatrophihabitans sp.]|uniref:YbjN domain-containing protein n=1 Tax=uncultured Jatrophihabitans sp. TaxID=1610747 RepID=UPI0035CC402F
MFRRRPRSEETAQPSPALSSRRHQPGGATMVAPTVALVQQLLDEFGLRHSVDDDGDLVVRWEKCSVYFFFYGERREVLQARMYLNRRFDVDNRASLTLLLDEWNRTKLFPKAFTILPDDGMVGICAEHCYDYETGATRAQFKYAIGMWIDTLLRFSDWIEEQL